MQTGAEAVRGVNWIALWTAERPFTVALDHTLFTPNLARKPSLAPMTTTYKRKRRASSPARGSTTPEIEEIPKPKRAARPGALLVTDPRWDWLDDTAAPPLNITDDQARSAYGFSEKEGFQICPLQLVVPKSSSKSSKGATGKQPSDCIEISDEEEEPEEVPIRCTVKACKKNPQCLNRLGQALWQDSGELSSCKEPLIPQCTHKALFLRRSSRPLF